MQRMHGHLNELEFFRGMQDAHLEQIAVGSETVRFEKGEMLLRSGERAERFYLIRHGSVGIELDVPQRGAVSVQVIGAGEALGWSWLFEPYRWQFDARALEPTRALAFDAARLRALMSADPSLGYAISYRLARVMAGRLQAARIQLLDVHGILT